jgi:DNA-binding beta-propeller fold protein YncE
MQLGSAGGAPGNQDSNEAYNRPTSVGFGGDGSFFITDGYVNSRVLHYSKDGTFVQKWGSKGTGDNQFNIVHDIVLDSKGRLYVADRENGRIQIFSQDGRLLGKWENIGAPWGLTYVERENAIYMADGVNDRVAKLNMEGQIVGTFGSHGKVAGRFDYPHSLAVDRTGAIYVAEIKNWRVQKFTK